MRALWAIARRDLRIRLRQPSSWWLLAGLHALSGLFLIVLVEGYVTGAVDASSGLSAQPVRIHDRLLAPWLGNTAVVLLLLGPAAAMHALADEVRHRTLPLLLSAPVSPWSIVLGSFLGAWTWTLAALATTLWVPLWLSGFAAVDIGALSVAYGGLALLCAHVVALGLAASAFTRQPTVALVLAAAIGLVLWILGLVDPDPTSLPSRLSLSGHLRDALLGLVRASDVVFLLSTTAWWLLAAHERVDAWRHP